MGHKSCEHVAGKGARISALGLKMQLFRVALAHFVDFLASETLELIFRWSGEVCVPVTSLLQQLFAPDSLLF